MQIRYKSIFTLKKKHTIQENVVGISNIQNDCNWIHWMLANGTTLKLS